MSMQALAAINNNDDTRQRSYSGGVFFELARWVIQQDGVVFGVSFDRQWNAVHTHVENLDGLTIFQGSKYVQSNVSDEYYRAKKYLTFGRLVLFSGTPCQIAGLHSFLQKDYDNLITVDFVCHGVPSPIVWQKYLKEVSSGRKIININFREKSEGWLRFSLRIDFDDGSYHCQTQQDDLYMKGFLQDIYLRPSCYECRFKGVNRESDITLADYWGVQYDIPKMFDNMGTSIVLLHSNKGECLWQKVRDSFEACEIMLDAALSHNKNAIQSVSCPDKRRIFYSEDGEISKRLKKLTKITLKSQIIQKSKAVVKKIILRD